MAMLTADEARDIFHWAGPVQRVHRDQVAEYGRFQLLHVFLHAGRFILEDSDRFATLEKFIGLSVVYREFIGVEFDTVSMFDNFYKIGRASCRERVCQ